MTKPVSRDQLNLSIPVTALLRGVLYRDTNELAWNHLRGLEASVKEYVSTLGLTVVIDDTQGYAYLRSRPDDELVEDGITRLVPRHRLSRDPSLLLVLLRKRLYEFDARDAADAGARLVLGIEEIRETMAPYMPTGGNQAQVVDKIDSAVGKVVSLGFLRRIPRQDGQFEVRRIITALVTGDWLDDFDKTFAQAFGRGAVPDLETVPSPSPESAPDDAPDPDPKELS